MKFNFFTYFQDKSAPGWWRYTKYGPISNKQQQIPGFEQSELELFELIAVDVTKLIFSQ